MNYAETCSACYAAFRAEREIADALRQELKLNVAMLAKQCDLSRQAEIELARLRAEAGKEKACASALATRRPVMHTSKTTILRELELEFEIEYNYTSGRPARLLGDTKDREPSLDAEIEILKVSLLTYARDAKILSGHKTMLIPVPESLWEPLGIALDEKLFDEITPKEEADIAADAEAAAEARGEDR